MKILIHVPVGYRLIIIQQEGKTGIKFKADILQYQKLYVTETGLIQIVCIS
jgi:hypothetical protein